MVKSKKASVQAVKTRRPKVSSKKPQPSKKTTTRRLTSLPNPRGLKKYFEHLMIRIGSFLNRRPHRSFRRTRRRDYVRSLSLPSYSVFTHTVTKTLRQNWKIFMLLTLFYGMIIFIFSGVTSQDAFTNISKTIENAGSIGEMFGSYGRAGLILAGTVLTGPTSLSVDQQIYLMIALLFVWLTTVWLLRERLAGRKPKLRDGLYSAGAPFIATLMLVFLALIQLLPIGFVIVLYAALAMVGALSSGLSMMIFTIFATLLIALSLYWLTSTFLALVVVTLPGMYPLRAVKVAGDLVTGRRLRILFRLLWMMLLIALLWLIVAIPLIQLSTWASHVLTWWVFVPAVPIVIACMFAWTVVWCSSYVYLLYRRIIDDDTKPA